VLDVGVRSLSAASSARALAAAEVRKNQSGERKSGRLKPSEMPLELFDTSQDLNKNQNANFFQEAH
jgi:hypothetical protein